MTPAAAPLPPVQQTLFGGDRCPVCAGPIEHAPTGRPATYCSAACRLRAHRAETKPQAAAMATPTVSSGAAVSQPATDASLAAVAAGIATPVDAYGPVRAYAECRDGGFGVVFGRDGGRVNEPAGPVFLRPRLAIDLADALNARLTAARTGTTHELAAARTGTTHELAAATPTT